MPGWFYAVIALCLVAVTIGLVVALAAAAGAARRTERVLATVEQKLERDLTPLLGGLRELTDQLKLLSRGATAEVERIEQITGRVQELTEAGARVLVALSGFTRTGQLIGIAAGLKTGVDVFLHRWRQPRGGWS